VAGQARENRWTGLRTWIEWATETADVLAQVISIALVTTAGTCRKQQPEG
jgi:hypothetical protein